MPIVQWSPPCEQRYVVERFVRATGADFAVLTMVVEDRAFFYESVATTTGAHYRGAIIDALERCRVSEIRHIDWPSAPGTDLLLAPVDRPGEVLELLCGVLHGAERDPDDLRWVATGYAHVLALCAEDPDGIGKLISSTREDPLTGCATRWALNERIDEEIARAERHGRDLACLFVDLDGFKEVNDHHGHLIGDEVLAAVGAALRGCMRSEDCIGRVGGDEFVVVLPETSLARAVVMGSRLRSALRRLPVVFLEHGVTASVGVASWHPGDRQRDLILRADRALLRAKDSENGLVAGDTTSAGNGSALPGWSRQRGGLPRRRR